MCDTAIRQALKTDARTVLADEFCRHRERFWRMVNFRLDPLLAKRVDPDDVLQEAWLAAAQRVQHFVNDESLSLFLWLRLIVCQTLVDVQRRHLGAKMRDAYREVSLDHPPHSATTTQSVVARLLGSCTSPSMAAVRAETARRLEEVIRSMDPIDRDVLVLRHFEELTNSEVAQVLGIQQKAASIRYVRALRRLRAILDQIPDFAEGAIS